MVNVVPGSVSHDYPVRFIINPERVVMNPSSDQWQFYKDKFGQWQWRKFENKKVVAVSADAYYTRQACVNNARARGYSGN